MRSDGQSTGQENKPRRGPTISQLARRRSKRRQGEVAVWQKTRREG